ncbi:aspartyl protease family protein [Roseateles sp. P5_E4]
MKMNQVRAAWALLAAALIAAPAWGDCKLSQLEIPVRIVNHRPVGTLNLNGTEVPMLIDSGAFFSFLTPSVAAQLNLRLRSLPAGLRIWGYTGSVEARATRVEKVIFQGTTLNNVEFIVGGNELGSGIQGVLGRNFLSMADAEYDLAHGVVRLMFPKGDCDKTNFAYWAGEAPIIVLPLEGGSRGHDTAIQVTARVNDREVRALLDTGAPRTSLKLRTAKRAGVKESDLTEIGRVGGAGSGKAKAWTGPIETFEFGGEKIHNSQFVIDEASGADQDMLLGLDYFLSHRIYVSQLQRKLYATWNGGAVFARTTPGQYDPRYAARPDDISPDDAAALARRGEASAARGEYERALEDLNRACELEPLAEAHFLARARVHLSMRQFAKAQADLDEALRLHPALDEALALRAALRVSKGERDGALADLQALDAALPPSSHLRAGMADVYARLELVPAALRQWELWMPSHRSDSGMARVLNNRCWLRVRLALDLKLALDDCKESVSLDGGAVSARDSLGWAYLRLDDASRALKAFDAAIEIKPLPMALYGRALAQRRLGNEDAARRDLEAARKQRRHIDDEVRKQGLPVAEDAPASASAATP